MAPITRCPASRCPIAAQATTTASAAAKGAAAPVASMPAAARQPHREITKIHRDKSHGRPETLNRSGPRPAGEDEH
jgi:hypothetical protein